MTTGTAMGGLGCVVLLVGVQGQAARADVAPPAGTKLVPVTGVVEASEPFDDYRFFLADNRTYHGRPRAGIKDTDQSDRWRSDRIVTETVLGPGSPVRGSGARREYTVLYAIPRSVLAPDRPVEDVISDVDRGKVSGAFAATIGGVDTLPEADPRGTVVRRYELRRAAAGGGLELARLDGDDLGADAVDPRVRDEESMVRWAVAGVAAAVAMCGFGLWFLGRRRRA